MIPLFSPRSTTPMLLQAPAKINLGLEVLRRRPDGYHDINTIFAAVDLCDEMELALRADGRIICRVEESPGLENDERNLCVQALKGVQRLFGENPPGFDLLLRKKIPIGGGLGGGSSDAATVLQGAAALLGDSVITSRNIEKIAIMLGSDVPFFLRGGVALATSRGEVLRPVAIDLPWCVLLVNPGIHISTPWAYAAVGRRGERPAADLVAILRAGIDDPRQLRAGLLNDFEESVFERYPGIGEIKENLYLAGADVALMSGSGATLFALFRGREAAELAQRRFPDLWSRVTTFRR